MFKNIFQSFAKKVLTTVSLLCNNIYKLPNLLVTQILKGFIMTTMNVMTIKTINTKIIKSKVSFVAQVASQIGG